MNCASIREQLPVLLDDRVSLAAAAEIRSHLEGCPECRRELTALSQTLAALDTMPTPKPTPQLRARVYAAIAAEQNAVENPSTTPAPPIVSTKQSHRPAWFWLIQSLAAVAVLSFGFLLGSRSSPPPKDGSATQRELAALRIKIDSMGKLVGYSLLQQQSRSSNERLRDILTSANVEKIDDKIIGELISALALDPSANVRLNALEALYAHADQSVVRAGVLNSLPREENPLVQVSMIDFLVATRDREATPTLQRLSDNIQIDQDVRVAAKRALNQL